MKPNLMMFADAVFPRQEQRRCCTDEPQAVARPATLRRWSSKLRVAVPSSVRVFRGAVRRPAQTQVGTQVRTPAGRPVGRVREVVALMPSGRTSYAVDDGHSDDARVLLIPQEALRTAGEHAVVEERVLEGLARTA